MKQRFELSPSDGKACAQVLVYDDDDLQYWREQANKNGLQIIFDYHVPQDAFGYEDPEHDVYQIFPPEQARHFQRATDREALLKGINDYLRSLPDDESRKGFLDEIDSCCHLCGSLYLPCYCSPFYDE